MSARANFRLGDEILHESLIKIFTRWAMKLTDEVFRSFRVAKVFRENTDRINCIDFAANGEHMISSSNDDSIVIYCCQEGRWVRFIWNVELGGPREGGET